MRLAALAAAAVLLATGCAESRGDDPDSDAAFSEDALGLANLNVNVGTVEWLERTKGSLSRTEWWAMNSQGLTALGEGFTLAALSRFGVGTIGALELERFAPPDTPLVRRSKSFLEARSHRDMVNHSIRTAYWTLAVMSRERSPSAADIETVWVASLLHDTGFDVPVAGGDFTLGSIRVLEQLAQETGWDAGARARASEAIAMHPNVYVNKEAHGLLTWAFHIGVTAEATTSPHRLIVPRDQLENLERVHPRGGFAQTMGVHVNRDAARIPWGRFALLKKLGYLYATKT